MGPIQAMSVGRSARDERDALVRRCEALSAVITDALEDADTGLSGSLNSTRLDEIERELERKVEDTHDYSSSRYRAFDDGFNQGVYEALEAVRKVMGWDV